MKSIFIEAYGGEFVKIGEYNKDNKPVFKLAVGAKTKDDARELIDNLEIKLGEIIPTDDIGSSLVVSQIKDLCTFSEAKITIIEKK